MCLAAGLVMPAALSLSLTCTLKLACVPVETIYAEGSIVVWRALSRSACLLFLVSDMDSGNAECHIGVFDTGKARILQHAREAPLIGEGFNRFR